MNIAILAVDTTTNSWGKGKTLKEAQTNLKKSDGKLKNAQYRAVVYPDNTDANKDVDLYKGIGVNEMGDVRIPNGSQYFKI